jgi:uncharacterized membrane protein YgcG
MNIAKISALAAGIAAAILLASCGGSSSEKRVSGVAMNKTSLILAVNSQERLVANVQPANATNPKVTWKSSNPAIASVDAGGMVKAHAHGQATITATTQDCGDRRHSSGHHGEGHDCGSDRGCSGGGGGGHHGGGGQGGNCNGGHTCKATVVVNPPPEDAAAEG